jgi:signal transduction histidine kinase
VGTDTGNAPAVDRRRHCSMSDNLRANEPVEQCGSNLSSQLLLYARDLRTMVHEAEGRARELAVANERLQRLDQLKMDFLSFISHELRTALTSMAMVNLLQGDHLDDTTRSVVDLVKAGYDRLEEFIAQGIEYFRVLAEDGDLSGSTTNLTALVETTVDNHVGLAVRCSLPDDACLVRGDAGALGRALDILFDNAIKHTDSAPDLSVEVHRGPTTVLLSVCDRGKGFDPAMADEITRPFTPADVDHHSTGSMVNLALAVQLVERCGGRLTASSEGRGRGARFAFELQPAGSAPATGRD